MSGQCWSSCYTSSGGKDNNDSKAVSIVRHTISIHTIHSGRILSGGGGVRVVCLGLYALHVTNVLGKGQVTSTWATNLLWLRRAIVCVVLCCVVLSVCLSVGFCHTLETLSLMTSSCCVTTLPPPEFTNAEPACFVRLAQARKQASIHDNRRSKI